jgi:hypothetical protein
LFRQKLRILHKKFQEMLVHLKSSIPYFVIGFYENRQILVEI